MASSTEKCHTLIYLGITCGCIIYLMALLNPPMPPPPPPATPTSTASSNKTLIISSDGYIRNCLTADVIARQPKHMNTVPLNVGTTDVQEDTKSRAASFKYVFDKRGWGTRYDKAYKGIQASGEGSTLYWSQEMTATLHRVVSEVRAVYGLSRVRLLDVPCGDMAWMSRFLRTRNDIDYIGIDIVPSLIDHHRKAYGKLGWKFFQRDVVQDGINGTYDIVMSRAMLQHLYTNDAIRVLAAISNSGSSYLLTTTFPLHNRNAELSTRKTDRYRRFNLEIEPVSLSPPLCIQRDGPPENQHPYVGLWRLPLKRVNQTSKSFLPGGRKVTYFACAPWE